MTYIIGNSCEGVCDTSCIDMCPVDCIHGPLDSTGMGKEVEELRERGGLKDLQLYIDPEECIRCGACLPECPVDAIYPSAEECISEEGTNKSVLKNYEFFGRNVEEI